MKQLSKRTNDNGAPGGNNLSRLSRTNFPKFEGEDVQGWIYKCEHCFEVDAIVKSKRVKIAAKHLARRALVSHQSLMKNLAMGVWPSSESYNTANLARFGVGPFDEPFVGLVKLKEVGSVAQYQEKFDALINRVDLSVNQAISCFLSGMCEEI